MNFNPFLSFVVVLLTTVTACNKINKDEGKKVEFEEVSDLENKKEELEDSLKNKITHQVEVTAFDNIIDSNDLNGSIVFFNEKTNTWFSNDFDWANKRRLPASTFKIVNSIIGLETKVVTDKGIQFRWDNNQDRRKMWRKNFDLHGAFHASCLPCYQELARDVGLVTMRQYVGRLSYGHMIVDSSSLDNFWIKGESGISQVEQIDFLQRLYNHQLPVSVSTLNKMKKLMVIDSNANYKLSGKTGWGFQNDQDNGWFVGYIEKDEDVYFFATNVTPKETFNMSRFAKIRYAVTLDAFDVIRYEY